MSGIGREGFASHFLFTEKTVAHRTWRGSHRPGFAERFFPGADPCLIKVARLIEWIVQQNGCLFRRHNGSMQKRP